MIQRIFEQLSDLALLAIISLVVGFIKILLVPEPRCLLCNVLTLIISVFVGTLAGALAMQFALGDYAALAISSVASLLSRDIVMAMLNNRQHLGYLFKRATTNIVDRLTGGSK